MPRWVRKFDCHSATVQDKVYTVSVDDNGNWGCSCPGWKFHREKGECHHILTVKADVKWKEGDMGTLIKLKVELIGLYKSQGKTEEQIVRRLTDFSRERSN